MKPRWLFLILFLSVWGTIRAQKIYVVSAGIADYKEINDLKFTELDVQLFNEMMKYQGAEIKTLVGQQATHTNIITALRTSFGKAQKEDTMIFFFSGHGYEGGFCCWDMTGGPAFSDSGAAQTVQDRNKLSTTNKYYGGLSYSEMQILFRNCRAGKKIVIADACFSGGLQKGNQLGLSVQSARNGDVIFMLSSQLDETSLELRDIPHGLFTYYLAKGLLGESDTDYDKIITIKELYDYVYKWCVDYATKRDHNQHPVLWGRYDASMPIFNAIKK